MVAVVAVDMVEPGEVVDLVVGMWAGESDEIDCENGEGLLATVCNECCEKSSKIYVRYDQNVPWLLEADLDMHMIQAPKDSRGPPEECLGRFGCGVWS